ncbi:MAG: radical SAM protein [Candidatus Bathyarchaeota archaeon]|nr:MAG: radical SAM protein [Candidatus Bathyarchaeota archaeon]
MVDLWALLRPDSMTVLRDKNARTSLERYFGVMQNQKIAKFVIAKKLAANFGNKDSTAKLWKKHCQLSKEFPLIEKKIDSCLTNIEELESPKKSFLDLKIAILNRILASCHLCSRRCRVNRRKNELGYCKCDTQIKVSTIFEHLGEEPELVPSGTIFTLGCTMRCCHCQNWTISQWMEPGAIYSPKQLAKAIENLRNHGCRNANLVGGEPTPWLTQWLETFKHVNTNVPIVWNSNSYYSKETAALLAGFADVYLLDFKYGNNECAKRISKAPDYWTACTRNHRYGKKYGELIIRVLVLPNHLDCCVKPIFKWIKNNLGPTTRVNVMFQYRPEWNAHEVLELRRRLNQAERKEAIELAKKAGLQNFIT